MQYFVFDAAALQDFWFEIFRDAPESARHGSSVKLGGSSLLKTTREGSALKVSGSGSDVHGPEGRP